MLVMCCGFNKCTQLSNISTTNGDYIVTMARKWMMITSVFSVVFHED
uniref:Uncharacterized protein n=1 Tax=Anguilla anguilla TaxID=7936 RepID=A0A0E9TA61_ANGAN